MLMVLVSVVAESECHFQFVSLCIDCAMLGPMLVTSVLMSDDPMASGPKFSIHRDY